jgi:hypothetical protein
MAATSGGIPISFEWYLEATKLQSTGAKKETYEMVVKDTDKGTYKCRAVNTHGQKDSKGMLLTITGGCTLRNKQFLVSP